MSTTVKVDKNNFEKEVLKEKKPVIVDFWAEWCGPCKMVAPVIEEIAQEYENKVKVCKVNVDDNQDLASEYDILSIPSILYFKNGEKKDQIVGYQPKDSIIKKFDI